MLLLNLRYGCLFHRCFKGQIKKKIWSNCQKKALDNVFKIFIFYRYKKFWKRRSITFFMAKGILLCYCDVFFFRKLFSWVLLMTFFHLRIIFFFFVMVDFSMSVYCTLYYYYLWFPIFATQQEKKLTVYFKNYICCKLALLGKICFLNFDVEKTKTFFL